MSDAQDGVDVVLDMFARGRPEIEGIVQELVADPEVLTEEAWQVFRNIAPDLAYLDAPHSALARALFFCAMHLAVYVALRERGVDVHAYGAAMLSELASQPARSPGDAESAPAGDNTAWARGTGTHPGEFVVEVLPAGADYDWGYNIKSCAICYLYRQHDAMDLVPYMCASDDVVSDQQHQGLRRTGTIALGAHQCDFRYQADGEPRRLAECHPDRIRFVHAR
jgi:hypothetical protein